MTHTEGILSPIVDSPPIVVPSNLVILPYHSPYNLIFHIVPSILSFITLSLHVMIASSSCYTLFIVLHTYHVPTTPYFHHPLIIRLQVHGWGKSLWSWAHPHVIVILFYGRCTIPRGVLLFCRHSEHTVAKQCMVLLLSRIVSTRWVWVHEILQHIWGAQWALYVMQVKVPSRKMYFDINSIWVKQDCLSFL
jgi:hypothetical protein